MSERRVILCLNVGSSTCKFAMYSFEQGAEKSIAHGEAKTIDAVIDELDRLALPRPDAVGHRIVHGGPNHAAPEIVTDELIAELKRLIPFAPLHMPGEIDAIEASALRLAGVPQVACFDTAFHRAMPELAQRLPLPRALWDEGIRRYGFHGISYEYIVQTLGASAPRRLVIAHLGNGASMAALLDGRPLETTMGFTPAGGFMMGTRSGDLDPGVMLYLIEEKGYDGARLSELVNHESGLRGVSGISADMKQLLEARESNPQAAEAIAMFCYQIRKSIGALAAVLGGLDMLVFTGGIGEHASSVRDEVCRGLEHLGVAIDGARNESHRETISTDASRCEVRVIATNENLMIARHTRKLLF
ncbi:MAG: acetate/propionate family kinase [Candidatus Binatus sp.]|uniref:acetate/propionate family kinase n=1 Tax=Candidatus Binatus sp. TaxID=2811406 RepID=UPI00271D22EC|nr:acetate/propionate family kinase [Candidatus Binatus sp.]MDO8433877.1 acetate/propionate family kinase [Candidatus Binatus sp.]